MITRSFKLYSSICFIVLFFSVLIYFSVRHRLQFPPNSKHQAAEAQQIRSRDRMDSDYQDDFIKVTPSKEDNLENFLGEIDNATGSLCPVFAFAKNISKGNEEKIKLWTRAWFHFGFQPYVLTEKDALSRPEYGLLVSKIPSLEFHAGYMRWLALSSVQGGLYADLDVLPLKNSVPLFCEYRDSGCKIPEDITISDEMKFNLFLINQENAKRIVKKLISEQYLKGSDGLWISLHAKEYRINKVKAKLPAVDLTQNIYYQRHRKWLKEISSTEQLKTKLIRANLMNNYKFFLMNSESSPQEAKAEALLLRTLECPTVEIKHDQVRVLPNLPFKCELKQIDTLKGFEISNESPKALFIILVHDPISNAVRSGKLESNFLKRVFPGIPRDNRDQHIKLLRDLIRSKQVLFVPADIDMAKIILFLEFNLGLGLENPSDLSSSSSTSPGEHIGEIPKDLALEKELYDFIVSYFRAEVAKLTEFDFQ